MNPEPSGSAATATATATQCMIVSQSLRNPNDINKCDLRELINLEEILGAGEVGVVYRITLQPGAAARGLPLTEGREYAMKIVIDAYAPEIELGEVLRRSNVPLINLVPSYYWLRWRWRGPLTEWLSSVGRSGPIPNVNVYSGPVFLIFMPVQRGPTLYDVTQLRRLTTARGQPFAISSESFPGTSSLPTRTLFMAAVLAQLYAAVAAIRTVLPTFQNPDTNSNNIMLSASGIPDGVDSVVYRLPNGQAIFVPLQATGGLLVKMLDFGRAYGDYMATERHSTVPHLVSVSTRPHGGGRDGGPVADALLYFEPSSAQEIALLRMARDDVTTEPSYFLRALETHPAFALLRIDQTDRDTLDVRYAELCGARRARDLETLHVTLEKPGSTYVAKIGACHVCGVKPARYHGSINTEALYCGERCFAYRK